MNKQKIKFETYKKGVDKRKVFVITLVAVIVGIILGNRVSHANFTSSLDVPFVRGKINYKHPDFKVMAMNIQESEGSSTYNESTDMPDGSEYTINKSKSYCTNGVQGEKDTKVVLETVNGRHVIEKLTKNDRCYLYFDVIPAPKEKVSDILAKYTKSTSRNGQITAAFNESTPTTVYSKEDDYGTSYVFAGVNPNNWVRIGNMYFRIIRFNGNGSMRLIYSGTGSAETSGTGTQIGKIEFSKFSYSGATYYIGLQYTSGYLHGNTTNSTILGAKTSSSTIELYGWYNNNIKNTYESLIDSNVGFCSDRDNYTDNNGTTIGDGLDKKTSYYYGTYIRYMKSGSYQTTFTPTLKCKNSADLLKLPVGLITADEYMLAGGGVSVNGVNEYYNDTFWLHTGETYWTMSPCVHDGSTQYPHVFTVHSSGFASDGRVYYDKFGVRPVINLKSTTEFSSGNGTASSPYTVSGITDNMS